MILVGLGLTFHDSSVAIYDNGKVIYWKAERESGQKHDHASVQAQLKKASSIVSGKIDEIAITGWSGADPKFLEKGNVSWINHHYAHVLSNTKKFDSNLVVDGAYTSPYNPQHQSNKGMGTPHLDEELVQFNVEKQKIIDVHGCYVINDEIEHIDKLSQPHFMYRIGKAMGFEPKEWDNPNKVPIKYDGNNQADNFNLKKNEQETGLYATNFDLEEFATLDVWEEYYNYIVNVTKRQFGIDLRNDKNFKNPVGFRNLIRKNLVAALDIPGKMMGLSGYHKLNDADEHYLDIWMKHWEKDERNTDGFMMVGNSEFIGNHKHFLSQLFEKHHDKIKLAKDPVRKGIPINGRVHELGARMLEWYARHMPVKEFSYSGGVAQNVVWNRRLLDIGMKPWIEPWAYDGGQSIGALHYLLDKHDIERPKTEDYKQFDQAPPDRPNEYTLNRVADLIAEGKTVGWYQGNGEVGPRALGYRSILANPTLDNGKEIINKVKKREWFRPFGASVKEDQASRFFDIPKSRYMLYNANVLYSGIPAVTHVDGTCRHQTVPESHTDYYRLLDKVEERIGVPIVLNTSLNRQGEPIAGSIRQAKQLYHESELDALCVGSVLVTK